MNDFVKDTMQIIAGVTTFGHFGAVDGFEPAKGIF